MTGATLKHYRRSNSNEADPRQEGGENCRPLQGTPTGYLDHDATDNTRRLTEQLARANIPMVTPRRLVFGSMAQPEQPFFVANGTMLRPRPEIRRGV